MNPENVNFQIPADLYQELREYCDQSGIPFLDFIEDALEKATYRDELERLTAEEFEMKKRIEAERALALKHGFSLGVMAATLALKGSLSLAEFLTPKEARELLLFQTVQGGQLKLFE